LDSRKAAANLRMHRVSFDEAATVLGDDFALTREDQASAMDAAARLIRIGHSSGWDILTGFLTALGARQSMA